MKWFLIAFLFISCANESKPPLTKEDSVKIDKKYNEVMEQAKKGFNSHINNNKAILASTITEVGFLYLAVINDGTDKEAMATYYCRLAKEYGKTNIKAVKVVDASTFQYGGGAASGKELGKSFCNH